MLTVVDRIRQLRRFVAAILMLTGVIGLAGLPDDVAVWGGILSPVLGGIIWGLLFILGLVVLVVPAIEQAPAPGPVSETSGKARDDQAAEEPAEEGSVVAIPHNRRARVSDPIATRGTSEVQPSLPRQPSLSEALHDGYRLRNGIPDVFSTRTLIYAALGHHVTTKEDVDRWEAYVEALIGDDSKNLNLFLYDPPPYEPAAGTITAALDPSASLRSRMDRRLRQLTLVIERL